MREDSSINLLEKSTLSLSPFADLTSPPVKYFIDNLSELVDLARREPNGTSAEIEQDLIITLRKQLKWTFDLEKRRQPKLAEAIYLVLLNLAEYFPIRGNDACALTLQSQEKTVYTSMGYQFDIEQLVESHNARKARAPLGEIGRDKWLLNPFTGIPFSDRDAQYLIETSSSRGIPLHAIRCSHRMQLVVQPIFERLNELERESLIIRGPIIFLSKGALLLVLPTIVLFLNGGGVLFLFLLSLLIVSGVVIGVGGLSLLIFDVPRRRCEKQLRVCCDEIRDQQLKTLKNTT